MARENPTTVTWVRAPDASTALPASPKRPPAEDPVSAAPRRHSVVYRSADGSPSDRRASCPRATAPVAHVLRKATSRRCPRGGVTRSGRGTRRRSRLRVSRSQEARASMSEPKRLVVGISGASCAHLAVRLLTEMRASGLGDGAGRHARRPQDHLLRDRPRPGGGRTVGNALTHRTTWARPSRAARATGPRAWW